MEAEITNKNGWKLEIPKAGFAPMPFMEWISTRRAGMNLLHNITNDEDVFIITLNGTKQDAYDSAMEYINANI